MSRKNSLSPHDLIDALPSALLVVAGGEILYANKTAEELGIKKLDDELVALCAQGTRQSIYEKLIRIGSQKLHANIHAQPLDNHQILLVIHPLGNIEQHPHASVWKGEVTRAAGVMAAMLAHEVKNPLSSIRGAAQLLSEDVQESLKPLADLIASETLRIRDLLDQVEIFSDERIVKRSAHNVHEILHYCIDVAKAGFARNVSFVERYDPSLPDILTAREELIQLLLNIIKNSSEALEGTKNPQITVTTSYESGFRLQDKKIPIVVSIRDNGPGITPAIRSKLFEPFNSSKEGGRGLGLAIVAKLASDLGVLVECDETVSVGAGFTLRLPVS